MTSPSLPEPDAIPRIMTSHHLSMLLDKPYGGQLVDMIRRRAWDEFRGLTEAHVDLREWCILCGTYHGRIQELNQHLRCHHSHWVPHVHSKTAQLCRTQTTISPCYFCGKSFHRSHACPVWAQIALILVNQPGDRNPDMVLPTAVLHCDVCHQDMPDLQTLHQHLTGVHRLEPNDWVPSRDLLGADPVCAHCLTCFTDKSLVRQHITRGQCHSFNAVKPPELLAVAEDWKSIIASGSLETLRQDPQMRLRMTLVCQNCGTRFTRQGDLALHLQTVHAELWNRTHTTVHLMIQLCFLQDGCYCNPSTTSRSVSHICPAFRQIAMLAQRTEQDLFLPWRFDPQGTAQFLRCISIHAALPMILKCVDTRQFSQLWLLPAIAALLSHTCILCGGSYHPALLAEHITAHHGTACDWVPELLPQLVPAVAKDLNQDFTCMCCKLIFNTPATGMESPDEQSQRSQLVQIHLQHHCPVLLQAALILLHGLPRRTGHPNGGPSSDRSFQGTGPHAHREVLEGSGRGKRRKKAQATTTSNTISSRTIQALTTDGGDDSQVGCREPGATQTRQTVSSSSCKQRLRPYFLSF